MLYVAIFFIVCNSLTSLLFWIYIYHHERTHEKIESEIKHPLFDKILQLECEQFDDHKKAICSRCYRKHSNPKFLNRVQSKEGKENPTS